MCSKLFWDDRRGSREDSRREASGPGDDDLRMAPEEMLDLARRAAELLVERSENLAEHGAWDGDFQQELEKQLMEAPPEEGRPAMDVLERAVRAISLTTSSRIRYGARPPPEPSGSDPLRLQLSRSFRALKVLDVGLQRQLRPPGSSRSAEPSRRAWSWPSVPRSTFARAWFWRC